MTVCFKSHEVPQEHGLFEFSFIIDGATEKANKFYAPVS